ncbi:MAG: hypothetical protein HQ465_03165 [Rhodospirillales bacterium]|nr:hypothetical protein [Rhodospirillales bacterium]
MRIATRTFVLALAALALVAGEAQAAPTAANWPKLGVQPLRDGPADTAPLARRPGA